MSSWGTCLAAVVVSLQVLFLNTVATSSRIILSNETDRMALLEFKSMISGDPLGALSSWNDSTHFCQWYGVFCSKRHAGRVTVLSLMSLQLSGSISPHIGNLSFLKALQLVNNSLSKEIPPEIGRLRRLQELSLYNNSLSGEIPSNISRCSALVLLYVDHNELVGQLPWQLGSLNKLQDLWANSNYLTGSVPPSFGNLSSFQRFQAGLNHLSGRVPDALGQLNNLQQLSLQINKLHGEIPISIFNISSLAELYFGFNRLHGSLPNNLGIALPNLQYLDVAQNLFTGSVPASLSNASNLILLQLLDNNFTGSMPSMESSHNLEFLYIYTNSLGNGEANDLRFLSSLTNASNLRRVLIDRNNFGGSLPEQIGNLSTTLEVIGLAENKFSGSFPSGIQNLVNLEWFDAPYNNFSGTIPSIIGNMQALQRLDLGSNNISGSIPLSIGNLTKLLTLFLDNNHLKGEIPTTLQGCKNLLLLDVSYNNLSGAVPLQVMSIASLSIYLNFSHNHLTGPIPIEVGSLKNLGSLDLSYNKLSSEVPSSLGNCIMLESLNLQGNILRGTIPSSFSSLRGIQELDISSNNLSGQIPKLFQDMKQLQLLNLSYNDFEGEFPSTGVFKNISIISVVGNSKLCGGVVELNLSPCNIKHDRKTLTHKWRVVISTISGILLLTFIGSCLLMFWIKRRRKQVIVSRDDLETQFSCHNLYKATDGFSTINLIGMGSFGSVYKGILKMNGIDTTIAVKVFRLQNHGASKSFKAECAALKNIRHRNLVKILTVCSSVDYQGNDFKALIYEFLARGSLEDWLHPIKSRDVPLKSLNFFQRLNIIIDVGSAIDYLHHQCGTPMVHCDLKPSNVLLNEDLIGHVSDFGLARFLKTNANSSSISQTSSSIGVKGTIGYAPPEYGMGHDVSIQGDVYSYGVLLLEMFTGKRPTNETFKEGSNIHRFVRSALLENQIEEILDPILLDELLTGQTPHHNNTISYRTNLKGQMLEHILIPVLEIGIICSSDFPHERIGMSEVVANLISLRKLLLDKYARRQRVVR